MKVNQFWSIFDLKIDQRQLKDLKSWFKDQKYQLKDQNDQLRDQNCQYILKKLIYFDIFNHFQSILISYPLKAIDFELLD